MVLPKESFAVTVMLNAVPAVCGELAVTVKVTVFAGLTVIPDDVPVMLAVTVSVAVMVCEPAVFRVAPLVKVLAPLVSVASAGNPLPAVAWPSVEVKWTVPVYPEEVLTKVSFAVTVTLVNATPAVCVEGDAATMNVATGAGSTTRLESVPVMLLVTVSVALIENVGVPPELAVLSVADNVFVPRSPAVKV